ncbi:MAG: mechanosensitive ion channel family protein [Bacteroidales bacterium]|nr:mechanosensitive ion channel family protein [Bacteroidales bacterium]
MTLAALIPPHKLAHWLLDAIGRMLKALGLDHSAVPEEVIYMITIIAIAIGCGYCVQKAVVWIVTKAISKRWADLAKALCEKKVLANCSRIIPPLVLLALIPFAFEDQEHTTHVILVITLIYFIVTLTLGINSVVAFAWVTYNTHRNTKGLPLKGIADVIRGAMWVIAVVIIGSMILDKSPAALLTGLGAFAAVLMLIFKDSILGLVAGVQLSGNDMLRVGDWIQVPGKDANGIVEYVSLIVVKVRNWNNTVTMVPPYYLVQSGFVNWRCIKETGSRQIQTSVLIDINTVKPLSDAELATMQKEVPMLKDYIDIKLKQRSEGKIQNVFNKEAGADGTIETNLGLLRAYYNIYVDHHPYIDKQKIHMVRILDPTPTGFPMQLFCYLTTDDWGAYEAIMADILEHITAIAPTFGLSVFEQPSGRSVYNIGASPAEGVPYYGTAPVISPDQDTQN